MENHDTLGERAVGAATTGHEGQVSIDRFEMTRRIVEQEEERAMAGVALYAQAARAWMQSDAPEVPDNTKSEEELEAMSQELKLRQKCQDIAALILADEQDLLDSSFDEEEE